MLYGILIATIIVSLSSIYEIVQGGAGENGSSIAVCFDAGSHGASFLLL